MEDLETLLPKLVSLFALAFFSFVPSIPAGLALGVSPVAVFFTTSLSYITAVFTVALLGERVRARVARHMGGKTLNNPNSPIRKVWDRYGVIGLGLLAPLITGAQLGVVLGLSLNAKPRALILWMCIGAVVTAALLTLALTLGILGIRSATS